MTSPDIIIADSAKKHKPTCAMADEVEEFSEQSSDEELQEGLARGTLKPGLIGRVQPPKTYTNNVSGLREALAALKRKGPSDWLERMDVTCRVIPPSDVAAVAEREGEEEAEEKELDPNDDFKREMWFYQQALSAVELGQRKLEEQDILTTRPDDYFAEMVKTDDHMRKVRERLLSRQKGLEQREKARKLRDLKKFGKKVQQEILQKRREEKKNAIKSLKKGGKGGKVGAVLQKREAEKEEEEFAVSTARDEERRKPANKKGALGGRKSKKQQFKDKKFGFGGKKHGQKRNSAKSSADMSGFSSARNSKPGAKRRNNRQQPQRRGKK